LQPVVPFLGEAADRRRAAKNIADALPTDAWRRLSAGAGTKGERLHEWAYIELADLDGDLAFFSTWALHGTTIERLAKIEGHRWAIDDSFETTKNELGLDHNETRSWHGWRRHVSLVMLAFAMMAAIRIHANAGMLDDQRPVTRPTG